MVVELRRELEIIAGCPENVPTLPSSWVTSIFDADALQRPWSLNCVYVGHGPSGCGLNPSPWGSPFASADITFGCPDDCRFLQYARGRADINQWLRPLVENCLICHSGRNKCHATDIAQLLRGLFGSSDVPEDVPYL